MQVPGGALHTSQASPQAVLQHKPSTQWREAHWPSLAQAWPLGRGAPQVPPTQEKPLAQSESAEHEVGQLALAPSQTKGAQLGFPAEAAATATQVPAVQVSHAWSQAELQHRPSTQCPERHCVPPVHAVPFCSCATQARPLPQ